MKNNVTNLTIADLNKLYTDADTIDKEIWAEQRSNILLSSGEHYSKARTHWSSRIRENTQMSSEQKIRLTKNHIYKIVRSWVNNILTQAPDVTTYPNNEKELSDQKAAELNKAVMSYAKTQIDWESLKQSLCKDFIEIGEVAAKLYFDPTKGSFVGYEQEVDENGQPVFDELGQPVSSDRAVFSGAIATKRIFAFNLLRDPSAKSIKDSPWLACREMVDVDELKKLVGDDEEKLDMIKETQDETYMVFDGGRQSYTQSKNQTMVIEYYFRPSPLAPNGYYYITTKAGVLFSGELPYGIFPIVYKGFDEVVTTPRHRSIIKQLRPYQTEINRAGSKMAEHQITVGDDKIVLQNGSKITPGPTFPGVRSMYVTGMAPTVMEGRSGEQYMGYMQSNITEMYQVGNVSEDLEEKDSQADPYSQLYKSVRNKKKFSLYAKKFEQFLVEFWETYLALAKQYLDEQSLIPAIGRSEYVNISEFKSLEPLSYKIRVLPMSDDIDTMMGKHLVFNHVLQYVGQQLDKDDIGKILRQMPFANHEAAFDDFTLDYDSATNIILALDRGQMVQPDPNLNGPYMLRRLSARMLQSDFKLLDPQIQAMYAQVKAVFEQLEAQKAIAIKQAQSEFIPSGGAQIKVDYYVPDPNNKTRSIRATVPAESIDWLLKQLNAQGSSLENMARQTEQTKANIAMNFINQQNAGVGGLSPV